ncbi:MAG: hypothetical protein MMC23_002851 [Stictis urceolatum]|nr:hypothetical protein [Stictis urceolata]
MGDQVRGDTGWRMKHWDGNHWFGVDVSNGRHHWFARTFWTSSEDCYNHCTNLCLLPATSYGFDSYFCRLRITNFFFTHTCTLGVTPDYETFCQMRSPKDHVCNDEYLDKHPKFWTTNHVRALRDKDSQPADNMTVWNMIKREGHDWTWYNYDQTIWGPRFYDPNNLPDDPPRYPPRLGKRFGNETHNWLNATAKRTGG